MNNKAIIRIFILGIILALLPAAALAQDTTTTELPAAYSLTGFQHIPQLWNNCGPATLTMGLTYFGYDADQKVAANWLKPNTNDGNVSPWQMVDYVNTQLPGTTRAINRVGGDLQLLKTLLVNNFPVIIEMGYDPEPDRLGWMGHYLLLVGYDDSAGAFNSYDSYLGPNITYTYDHVNEFWAHFNRTYIILYDYSREAEVQAILGDNVDPLQNALNALEMARNDAMADAGNAFAWFDIGTNYVALAAYDPAAYDYAVAAYDEARKLRLPYRITWYEFGMFEAYNAVGRYQDVIELARTTLDQGGTAEQIEEIYYYAGIAREALGDNDRALLNFNTALEKNPNFTPAEVARDALLAQSNG
ncbi:MAG: C39 family peptidase [Anaerolineaceae bacterium]|nr:C39 family peptidase [Anaerolineaceae bacterium]